MELFILSGMLVIVFGVAIERTKFKAMLSDNQKALALFSVFFIFMGCAGQGDYEYAKRQEAKHIKADDVKMCK